MRLKHAVLAAISAALVAASPLVAAGGSSTVTKKAELAWKDMGNGVAAAPVSGDMQKGASRFFLKYPAGLVTPLHHHNADHYVTVVSGRIVLNVDGKDHKLGPGDYFALTHKAAHTAKVEGKDAAVFFIQADAPWDVVMEQ
jgi:quercetin dioxygenase-like cupin family protein